MSSPPEPTVRRRDFIRADPNLPVHTVGECRGSSKCGQYRVDLADGWCVSHWDIGRSKAG